MINTIYNSQFTIYNNKHGKENNKAEQKSNISGSGEDGGVVDGWVWVGGGTGVE